MPNCGIGFGILAGSELAIYMGLPPALTGIMLPTIPNYCFFGGILAGEEQASYMD